MKKILRLILVVVLAIAGYLTKTQVVDQNDTEPTGGTTTTEEVANASEVAKESSSTTKEMPKSTDRPRLEREEPKTQAPPTREEPVAKEPEQQRYDVRGESQILNSFRAKKSDVQIRYTGPVVHILPYDDRPPRHQNWLMELSNGHTIKVSHNTDLAPKIPTLKKGDTVTVYGEYEYNEKGGVIHWTHHDPRKRHIGGYIMHNGKKYE